MKKQMHYSLGLYPLRSSGYRAFVGFRPVWRFWGHWINPQTYWRAVKYFCQRGYRGYADCDHWDMDSYLENVMLGLFRNLKKHTQSYPSGMGDRIIDTEGTDTGFEKWQAILTEIIEGLEASQELKDEFTVPEGTYSKEPICWEPVEGLEDCFRMKETETPCFNKELHDQWSAPLKRKCLRAKTLMARYWGCFWD